MIMIRAVVGLACVSQMLVGCAEMTHLTRVRPLRNGTAILVDAKQRGIFEQGGVTCAEPSPDALSALAASQSANVQTKGTTAAEAVSIAEAAGSIGLRTQSIQLMRDHMYRLCEAYQNKAINSLTFELLHRRFQTEMVAILAIEQLTGTVRAPAIVLGGSSSAGNADAIMKLTATRETAAQSLAAARQDLATKEQAETDATADVASKKTALDAAAAAADKAAAQTALDGANAKSATATSDRLTAQDVVDGRKAALDAVDRSLTLAQASGSASATGTIETVNGRGPADIAAVASAVQQIVLATMNQTNTSDLCALLLAQSATTGSTIDRGSPTYIACVSKLVQGTLKIQ